MKKDVEKHKSGVMYIVIVLYVFLVLLCPIQHTLF